MSFNYEFVMFEGIIFLQQASIHHLFIYSFILTINQSINKLSNFHFFSSTHLLIRLFIYFLFFVLFFCLLNINLPVRPSVRSLARLLIHLFALFVFFVCSSVRCFFSFLNLLFCPLIRPFILPLFRLLVVFSFVS